MSPPERDVTQLLKEWSKGSASALEELMPLVFDDLRQLARRQFQGEPPGHTLQPTALVNEVYVRLVGQRQVHWENRGQFFSFAAMLMRRVLVDYAKAKKADKRGKGLPHLPLDEGIAVPERSGVDMVALDEALSRLAALDARQGRIVELRFFVGLTNEQVAETMGLSLTTVKREWQTAKLWLYDAMTRG
jgi:RNA polymerase sigma factor (TIGR02999 family)